MPRPAAVHCELEGHAAVLLAGLHLVQRVQRVVQGGHEDVAGHVRQHAREVNGVAHQPRGPARQALCKGSSAANHKGRLHARAQRGLGRQRAQRVRQRARAQRLGRYALRRPHRALLAPAQHHIEAAAQRPVLGRDGGPRPAAHDHGVLRARALHARGHGAKVGQVRRQRPGQGIVLPNAAAGRGSHNDADRAQGQLWAARRAPRGSCHGRGGGGGKQGEEEKKSRSQRCAKEEGLRAKLRTRTGAQCAGVLGTSTEHPPAGGTGGVRSSSSRTPPSGFSPPFHVCSTTRTSAPF